MRIPLPVPVVGVLILLPVCAADVRGQDGSAGRIVYDAWCAECHGETGEGDGSAAASMLPRPRDFTRARYQIRTTGSGDLPTDEDLDRVLLDGLEGTTMPGWPNLSPAERRDVIAYIKSLSGFFEGVDPQPMEFSSDPGGGEDAIESGRAAYATMECNECHGVAGRGDGPSAPDLEDWRGFPIRVADLTEPWAFNGGSEVEDIHTRILTGLDGTPMPAAIDAMNSGVVSPEEVWHLAHYVASLAPEASPRVVEVVRVGRVEPGGIPALTDDSAWADVRAFFIPLVGQVIEPPRNFAPTVDGVWVQGMHDGSQLTLRLRWDDPSRSPDPAWDVWLEKLAGALDFDGAGPPAGQSPDAVSVQFPFDPADEEPPYFLMGNARAPVYQWRWDSSRGAPREVRARGMGSEEPLEGGGLGGEASWADGRWTAGFTIPVLAPEGADRPSFEEGRAIPMAFAAWDGSSGETGRRAAVSSWYFMHLERPASQATLITPLLAALLTALLGLVLVRRAQSAAREP